MLVSADLDGVVEAEFFDEIGYPKSCCLLGC
jgi:hypothetical protein